MESSDTEIQFAIGWNLLINIGVYYIVIGITKLVAYIVRLVYNNLKTEPVHESNVSDKYMAEYKHLDCSMTQTGASRDNVKGLMENVDIRLDRIIDSLKADRTLGTSQIAKQLGITYRTVQRDLEKLSKEGRIKRAGSAKRGYWLVIDK